MHSTRFLRLACSSLLLATAACAVDSPISPKIDSLADRVRALGFSTAGMQDYGSYVVVEGDIRLEKSALLDGSEGATPSTPSSGGQFPFKPSWQYSANQIVSQSYVNQITLDLTNINSVSNWASAVRTAISAYNASESGIHMSEASPGDITFYTTPSASWIAQSEFPYQATPTGKPGHTVTINTTYNSLALNQKQWVMVHELGHTLGLRHDDAPDVDYDGAGTVGANLIPGTPVSDPSSVMWPIVSNQTWPGFSYYDLVALRTLYPPPFSVEIIGPDQVTAGLSYTWSAYIIHGGTPPYTYQWSGILSGTGSSVTGSPSRSDDLVLNVWDAAGHHDATAQFVTVTSCGSRGGC